MTDYLAAADEHLRKAADTAPAIYSDAARKHLDIARVYAGLAAIEKGLLPGDVEQEQPR